MHLCQLGFERALELGGVGVDAHDANRRAVRPGIAFQQLCQTELELPVLAATGAVRPIDNAKFVRDSDLVKDKTMMTPGQRFTLFSAWDLNEVYQKSAAQARTAALVIGGIAGLCMSLGLVLLYRGYAVARMGIVAPLSSVLLASVPVLWDVVNGVRPGAIAAAGMGVPR